VAAKGSAHGSKAGADDVAVQLAVC
jgi:hypothetical protein